MKRWKPLYAIVAVAVVLLLLAAALSVRVAGRKPGPDPPRPTATIAAPLSPSSTRVSSGRERCMRKCAAQHLGYIYGAEQRAEAPGSRIVQPETCTCM